MNLRRIRNALCAGIVGFIATAAVLEANDLRDRRPGQILGGIQIHRYCEDTFGEGATALRVANDAYGWMCAVEDPIFNLREIDMDDVCTTQHDVPAEARPLDVSLPDSWRCYSK